MSTENMLEYSKTILSRVSFDRKLFCHELRKFLDLLVPEDAQRLWSWAQKEYYALLYAEMGGLHMPNLPTAG